MPVAPPPVSIDTVIERQRLHEELRACELAERRWVRQQVLEYRRLDILAEVVLGLTLMPFHRSMQAFTLRNDKTLQLAFRGSGKTTTVTEVRCIAEMLWDPNVRILIVARTGDLARDMLGEIKQFIETDKFQYYFGDLKGEQNNRERKWTDSKITIGGRTIPRKEPTITTVGTEGQVVGKHFDRIFADDLIDENNARTQHMREQVRTFFYKTLTPTLEPDGQFHIVGTRYHFDDIYGQLMSSDDEFVHQVIQALDDKGRSPWPQKYPAKKFETLRKAMGSVLFDTQFQCSTDKMRGGLFQWDWMPKLTNSEAAVRFGNNGQVYIGVDPSVGEKEQNDYFAMVCIRRVKREILVEEYFQDRLTFSQQLIKIAEWFDKYDPVNIAVEANAYQAVLAQQLAENYDRVRRRPIRTTKDKVTRAIKLSAKFESEEIFFREGQGPLMDHLLLFPKGSHDDLFDALDLAVTLAFKRGRRRTSRVDKVGLL
jgi:predicted phage terminase large subunit-like protein